LWTGITHVNHFFIDNVGIRHFSCKILQLKFWHMSIETAYWMVNWINATAISWICVVDLHADMLEHVNLVLNQQCSLNISGKYHIRKIWDNLPDWGGSRNNSCTYFHKFTGKRIWNPGTFHALS
jgi:hypothetical protein